MLRRVLLAFLCLSVLVAPASATWSIVVVNRRTGEVAVGGATCIARINLLAGLTTVVPGVGAGVIQASGDSSDLLPMTVALGQRLDPSEVLALVIAADSAPRVLQTGIVALYPGAPVTYTGTGCGRAKGGRVGEFGDYAYAIQGNVLAGTAVLDAAEAALVNTAGDTSQRLMAAMLAARELGGDGRCSCDFSRPDSCGTPPPNFQKSAHVGFMVVARMGDEVPPCVQANGNDCSDGAFHLRLNIRGADASESDPDPVDQLAQRYADWRTNHAGHADGVRSTVDAIESLPADGLTKRVVTVQLVDIEGVPLDHGGASVRVSSVDGARLHVVPGPVSDLGDGRYRFTLTSTRATGTDRLSITVEDGLVPAKLYPYPEVQSVPPAALHAGRTRLSASRGGEVPFVLDLPALAGGDYLVLASASGTAPGTPMGRAGLLPLVRDPWFTLTARLAGDARVLPGTRGVLDANGRGEASFVAPPGALLPLLGARLSWAALAATPGQALTTPPVSVTIEP